MGRFFEKKMCVFRGAQGKCQKCVKSCKTSVFLEAKVPKKFSAPTRFSDKIEFFKYFFAFSGYTISENLETLVEFWLFAFSADGKKNPENQ